MSTLRRRDFIRAGVAGAAMSLGPLSAWQELLAAPVREQGSPYGPLGPPDANGIRLPEGFRSRVIARANRQVAGTRYVWPVFPDGAATFATRDGGWVYVCNSEYPELPLGGASAIRFDRNGEVRSAYRVLSGTQANCAGGATPWGTWLSCEEFDEGRVWECDPGGRRAAIARPALGVFKHEAAAVDPRDGRVYLTEDTSDGGFYRFTPRRYGDLREGKLEIARRVGDGVEWRDIPDPSASERPTRQQRGATAFRRGEGCWYDDGVVYFATTIDFRIWAYEPRGRRLTVLYDAKRFANPTLTDVDNVTAHRSGDIFVCENAPPNRDPLDIAIISATPRRRVGRFLKVTGSEHRNLGDDTTFSELAGACFSPRGDRLYFSSQRGEGFGITYEIRGPFRGPRKR